jgi:hypothetical protein
MRKAWAWLAVVFVGCGEIGSGIDAGSESPDAQVSGPDGATADARPMIDGPAVSNPDARPGGDAAVVPDGTPGPDAASNACAVYGAPGTCIDVSACAAMGNHTAYSGYCAGSSSIECCIVTPNPANNPPTPTGWKLMQQSQVTPDMTNWAVMILHDSTDYPMFSTTTMMFGNLLVLARVEWHPPDFQNGVVHRGVTLYVPSS